MGIIKNIKSFLKQEIKTSRTSVTNLQYGQARWMNKNFESYVNETYLKNSISFRCMDLIAKSVASVPWKLFQNTENGRIEITEKQNDYAKLVKRANPDDSWTYHTIKTIINLICGGQTFIEGVGVSTGSNKGQYKELYCLRPDYIKIELNRENGNILKYVYNDSIYFEVDPITRKSDLLQIKLFNPLDEFMGASPIQSGSREIDSSNEAIEWNKKILENEGRPGMLFLFKHTLTEDQRLYLETAIKEKYSGSNGAGKNIILEGGGEGLADVKPYNWSPKELDFLEGNRDLARRICLIFGVPPMLLGIPGDATYSNMEEARLAFWEETVFYYLTLLRDEYNNWLFKDQNIFYDYVLDKIPALEYKKSMLWERAKGADFLTVNEKRELVGYEQIEGGDVILMPANMIPIDSDSEMNTENPDEENVKQKLTGLGYSSEMINNMMGLN